MIPPVWSCSKERRLQSAVITNQILNQDMGPFLFLLLTVLKVSLLSFPHSQKSVILGWILLRPEIPS